MKFVKKMWVGLLFSVLPLCSVSYDPHALGGFSISVELFKHILDILEPGSTILEMGSGSATGELAKFYTMYSVEHDKAWMDKYDTHYTYAPIKNYQGYRWYDVDIVAANLPKSYDLILVDGPVGHIGRYGFFKNLHLFNTNTIMIFDDVNRQPELKLLKDVSQKVGRPFRIFHCTDGKSFGVIYPQ